VLKDAREGNIVVTGTTEPAATGVMQMHTKAARMGSTECVSTRFRARSLRAGWATLAALLASLGPTEARLLAQAGPEEAAVLAVVDRLFDGMRQNDGDIVRSVFVDGASLISTEGRDGSPQTRFTPSDGFAEAVGGATVPWDEPYWDPVVQIHDHLATVWIKYAFYLDGAFSHCGVDALILTRTSEGWKIAALADTRESDNCELPPDRQPHPF
jgi:hypothetical protein